MQKCKATAASKAAAWVALTEFNSFQLGIIRLQAIATLPQPACAVTVLLVPHPLPAPVRQRLTLLPAAYFLCAVFQRL